ncbi:hypothetical protein HU200_027854 [Digitaria exilis]|uniref:NB-ARC domain-containing protein n=1 Tax=Digitaria exilis TaxID=1010633 RepID=A0A835EQA2_9POAL|nr:hypothetical protein HU200_027854 [Digitaria exilis]
MEMLLSTILGEVTTRCINFIISKCPKPQVLDVDDHLRKLLLRAQVIIDEAMGRHITNHAMLQQLEMDTFRYQSHDEDSKHQVVSRHSSSLSRMNSLKGFCSSTRETQILEQLQGAYDSLNSMVVDVEGLVVFLVSYPRMYRQPYSMHLLLGNCMFGRQMEAEVVLTFLLHKQHSGAEELEVLPIVGPGRVGKSTLVAHVCKDERVCDHFSQIIFLHGNDFTDDDLTKLREGRAMKPQSHMSNLNKDGRLLLIVELVGDLNDDTWNRLYFASRQCMPRSSKIIVTSQSEKIMKFGTTQALSLKNLSHEAFWYFFKTLTFGSMNPEMHPNFVRLAMEIARMQSGCLIGANITANLLRDNFDIRFWCKFGEHPYDLISENKPAHLGIMAAPSVDLMVYCQYERSSQEEVPSININDVMYGNVKPHGKFEALAWKSQIPPYYSYTSTCEIQKLKGTTAKRKRSMKCEVTLC